MPALPQTLVEELAKTEGPFAQVMAIRRGDAAAIDAAAASLGDASLKEEYRIALRPGAGGRAGGAGCGNSDIGRTA